MTVTELLRHNFDKIFIEFDPVKREGMMRHAYTEDCVWMHPGGRLVGMAAINEAPSEIRKRIPEYRYAVIGDIHTVHNVGMCRWGSGLPGQPYRYTGTDVLEERDGRVAVFYTFIDSGTPPISTTTSGMALATAKLFVEEGAHVFITGRRQQQLDEAVKAIMCGSLR